MSTHECFLFEVTLEIKEKSETANTYDLVPRQKGIFKLRSNVEKKVVVSVQQISQNSCNLAVERCFGMLVSPGRNVRHADMQLLEHVTMATTSSPNADVDVHANVITGKKKYLFVAMPDWFFCFEIFYRVSQGKEAKLNHSSGNIIDIGTRICIYTNMYIVPMYFS